MTVTTVRSKEVRLVKYCKAWPTEDIFQVAEQEVALHAAKGSGDIVLKLLWSSVDPYIRSRLQLPEKGALSVLAPFELGKAILSRSVGTVVASDNPNFAVGDAVASFQPVSEYVVTREKNGNLIKLDPSLAPLSYHLGVLGSTGLTAWVGLVDIGQPRPGEQVFVTAASGAVGLVVGQLAKIKGCRVVGSVSSDEKVDLLKREYGFDDAFNYKKETDWDAALTKYFPSGIDIYFENVGGPMLDAVLNHVNNGARIPVCGMVSQYNLEAHERHGTKNLIVVIGKEVKIEGFMVSSHYHKLAGYVKEVAGYIKEGRLKSQEHVSEGIENWAKAFIGMLRGENVGKALVKVGSL